MPLRLLAVLALAGLAACGVLRVPPPFPGAPVVRGLNIEGAGQVDPELVRSRLGTAVTGRMPWDAPRRFDPVVWADDLVRIPRIYRAEGFYSARVVSSRIERRPDGVVPTVTIDEGPPTRIVEVAVRGLEGLPPDVRRRAEAAEALELGQPFRESDWEATKAGILGALRSSGYAEARLESEARVDPDDRRARAVITAEPGDRFRFGDIDVVTPPPGGVTREDIAEEVRAAVPRDGWYDPAALPEAQARVFRMGAFSAVEVAAGRPDPRTRRVPITIAVRSGPPQTVNLGAGVGLSSVQDDVHVTGEWNARVSRVAPGPLRIRGEAGYALVPPIATTLSAYGGLPARHAPFARLLADTDLPRAFSVTGLHLFGSSELDLSVREAYRSAEARPSVGLAWNPTPRLELQLVYRLIAADVFDTPLGVDPARPGSYGCAAPCLLSGLELVAAWDTHRLTRPEEGGVRLDARLRRMGLALGGAYDLLAATAAVSGDTPVATGQVLAYRLGIGTALSTGSRPVPVLERLSGGGETMRGYGAGRLSPLMGARIDGRESAVPVGGRGLLEGTLELRQPLGAATSLLVFGDAGAATVERFAPSRILHALTYAVGAGVRFGTPLGPLRIEFAYRLPFGPSLAQVPAADGASLPAPTGCFGVGRGRMHGGGPDSPCRLIISLGEAR